MPQMFPLNWIILYILFTLILIVFNIMNYYNMTFFSNQKNNFFLKSFKKMNWKW